MIIDIGKSGSHVDVADEMPCRFIDRRAAAVLIDDDQRVRHVLQNRLQLLVLQLERELETAAFDPLKDLDSITVADTKVLSQLCADVQRVLAQESARTELVKRIVAIAKPALRAGGVPIPA
jgi:hypothetical protein